MVFADGRDGLFGGEVDSVASQGLTNKDGLNGKNANDKANALRNGEAGVVIYTDKDGNRLVKAKDGKYYKADEILEADGRLKDIAGLTPVDKPTLSLVNTDGTTNTPVQLSNVASGLNVEDKVKGAVITKEDATKAVSDTLLTEKGKELQKATNLADLQALAVAGVNYKGDTGETIYKNVERNTRYIGTNIMYQ